MEQQSIDLATLYLDIDNKRLPRNIGRKFFRSFARLPKDSEISLHDQKSVTLKSEAIPNSVVRLMQGHSVTGQHPMLATSSLDLSAAANITRPRLRELQQLLGLEALEIDVMEIMRPWTPRDRSN